MVGNCADGISFALVPKGVESIVFRNSPCSVKLGAIDRTPVLGNPHFTVMPFAAGLTSAAQLCEAEVLDVARSRSPWVETVRKS